MQNCSDDKLIELLNNGNIIFMKNFQRNQEFPNKELLYVQLRFHNGNPGQARILELQMLLPLAIDTSVSHDLSIEDNTNMFTTHQNGYIVDPLEEPLHHITNTFTAPLAESQAIKEINEPSKQNHKPSNICKKIGNSCNESQSCQIVTHTGEKTYQCSDCDKSFIRSADLKRHQETHKSINDEANTGEKAYQCGFCDKSFSAIDGLAYHLKTHTEEQPYQCRECYKSFKWKSDLMKHHQNAHPGVRRPMPYQCNQCNKTFPSNRDFQSHMNTHTGEKPYLCCECGKTFSSELGLTHHKKIHTGEKPYQCRICSKDFRQLCDLKSHINTHTGEKPYICSQCNKAFSQNSHLRTHMRIHTGEKPYQCNFCDKAFNTNGNLKLHKKTHSLFK